MRMQRTSGGRGRRDGGRPFDRIPGEFAEQRGAYGPPVGPGGPSAVRSAVGPSAGSAVATAAAGAVATAAGGLGAAMCAPRCWRC